MSSFSGQDEIQFARSGLVTRHNYSRLGYERLFQGVYGRTKDGSKLDEFEQRRAEFIQRVAAVLAAYDGKGAKPFGPTAFQVMGVALPERLADWETCHISWSTGRRPEREGVASHRGGQELTDWRLLGGIPLAHPVEHWLQLRGASEAELVEVGDGLVRRQHPILSLNELRARVADCDGRPRVKNVRRALKSVVPGTDSLYETRTRLLLTRSGLPSPVVNCEVFCPKSRFTFHVDLGYPQERVAVEYDGVVHVGNRQQMEIDANRRRLLQDEGWIIITVTAAQLRNPMQVVRSVESALLLRQSSPTTT